MNTITQKPELLKQNDIISFYHIQMPHWLFADSRYNTISLAAKVAYSLLLNRYQLSKLHGWINSYGEVYIIYPREELAETLRVGATKAIGIFKELTDAGLVWEVRRGNNRANHIYLTRVKLSGKDADCYNNAPFLPEPVGDEAPGSAEFACPDDGATCENIEDSGAFTPSAAISGHAENEHPDAPKTKRRDCGNSSSGDVIKACPDMQNPHLSYFNHSQIDSSHIEKSQSVVHARARESPDGQTDFEIAELEEILERCELWTFKPETAKVFENAIERLYFAESYKIGKSVLPQQKVRSHLHELDQIKLQTAEQKIAQNTEKTIRNTTAYTMAVIFNSIWETVSDIMNDPYLNSLNTGNQPANCGERV